MPKLTQRLIRPLTGPLMRAAPHRTIEGVGVRTLDIAGPELVTNGEFTSDISGWTDGSSAGGAISWSSGKLRTVNTSGTARGRQQVTVENGERYAFAVQNVGSPSVAGAVSLGTSAGGSQYTVLGGATNPAVAQRVGISEFTASSTAAHIQVAAGVAGTLDWDHATMRKLIATKFPIGTIITDDFAGDGPLIGRRTPTHLVPWRIIQTTNGAQVVPETSGGKLVVTPNASGDSASYPYLDFGDGRVTGVHCDLSWTGAGAVAMISVAKTGARLTIANIVANSLHIVFTDAKVDITKYVGGVTTTETVNYGAAAATDGTIYSDVGWFLDGSTLTIKLPDTTITRTDSDFATVAGGCGVVEHYYSTPPTGGVSIEATAMRLAA